MVPLIVSGRLHFPDPDAMERWRALELATFDDWPEDAPLLNGHTDKAHATVGEVRATCRGRSRS